MTTPAATEEDRTLCSRDVTPVGEFCQLGVSQFHEQPLLRKRFYLVTRGLAEAGCIVDLWLMDIATVMSEFGYEMTIVRKS